MAMCTTPTCASRSCPARNRAARPVTSGFGSRKWALPSAGLLVLLSGACEGYRSRLRGTIVAWLGGAFLWVARRLRWLRAGGRRSPTTGALRAVVATRTAEAEEAAGPRAAEAARRRRAKTPPILPTTPSADPVRPAWSRIAAPRSPHVTARGGARRTSAARADPGSSANAAAGTTINRAAAAATWWGAARVARTTWKRAGASTATSNARWAA